jgi:uncharacterized membrane protein
MENELDLSPLTAAPLAIQIHVFCAVPALILGPVALFRASRDIWHKVAGRAWVLSMIGLAGSSLFIHEARMFGPFSPIHLLSVITFVGLFQGLRFAIVGSYAAHGRAMRALYLQALILAGVFTFLPGRRMNAVLFGQSPEVGFGIVAALGVLAIALIWRAPSLRRALR